MIGAVLVLLFIHPTPAELIMSGFVAGMALLVLACDLLPSPEQGDTDEVPGTDEADGRDDVRQPGDQEPGELAAAA